jgi:hypothetical protein
MSNIAAVTKSSDEPSANGCGLRQLELNQLHLIAIAVSMLLTCHIYSSALTTQRIDAPPR